VRCIKYSNQLYVLGGRRSTLAMSDGDYSEQSYYEEEYEEDELIEEEVYEEPAPPSPSRPVHPLFAGGNAKNALAAAASNMTASRSEEGEPKSQPAPTQSSSSTRPTHPLFGGGGIGGGEKADLNAQIAAMAAKRNKRVKTDGPTTPTPKQTLATSSISNGPPTGSLAEQVAQLAARRQARLDSGEPLPLSNNDQAEKRITVTSMPSSKPASKPKAMGASKPLKAVQKGKAVEAKKQGGWFGKPSNSKKGATAAEPKQVKKIVYKVPAKQNLPPSASETKQEPAFVSARLKSTTPLAAASSSVTPQSRSPTTVAHSPDPIFRNAKLRTTGIDTMAPPKQLAGERPPSPEPTLASQPRSQPMETAPLTETTTTTTTVTKKIVRHDPEYGKLKSSHS
jgi:hypothetical protein